MDAAMLWVTGVGAAAAVAAAVFALVQAKAATDDRKDAESARDEARAARDEAAELTREANTALHRQAEAQEKALPPAWSGAITVGKHGISFRNDSARQVVVEAVEVMPAGLENLARHDAVPMRVEYGDTFNMMAIRTLGGGPERVTLAWRFEDEDIVQYTERRL